MLEFDKLIRMLDKSGIPYERDDDNFMMLAFGVPVGGIKRIKYPKKEEDSVVGDLTAKDVFGRINKHYKEKCKNE